MKVVTFKQGEFRLHFPYDNDIRAAISRLPLRSFHKQDGECYWAVSNNPENYPALPNLITEFGFSVDQYTADKLHALRELRISTPPAAKKIAITVETSNGEITRYNIATPGYNPTINALIKSTNEASWNGDLKHWTLPFTNSATKIILTLVSEHNLTINDDVVSLINAQNEKISALIALSSQSNANIDIPSPANLNYLGYQKAGIAYAVQKGNALIADEQGLGKTIQAIGIANSDPSMRRILLIVPSSLKLNWIREWRKWDVKQLSCSVVKGGKPEHWPTDANVVIINFDLIGKHIKQLHAQVWDMIVVDEAHNLRNNKTKRTKLILGYTDTKGNVQHDILPHKRLILMTGSPIVNRPVELWPLISAVAPQHFNNFFQFAKRYCDAKQNNFGWDFSGASNLDELQQELRAHCMVRRLKADVLTELPPKTRQIITLDNPELAKAEKTAIDAIQTKIANFEAQKVLAFLSNDPTAYYKAVTQLKTAQKAAFEEMSKLRRETAIGKVPAVVELVADSMEQGKIILFAHHHEVIDLYKQAFGDAAVVVDGRATIEQRQAAVDRFQNDETCRVFIGSIQAAGVGLTLTASSHVIFAELDWVPGNMNQAEDRAHRIGQLNNVLIWHVVVDGTIDSRMAEILIQKQEIITSAMDDRIEVDTGTKMVGNEEIEDDDEIDLPLPDHQFQIVSSHEIADWLESRKEKPIDIKAARAKRTAKRAEERAQSRGFTREAEQMTSDQVAAVHENLRRISNVCDGAVEHDGHGFSASDAAVGNALAQMPAITPLQAAYARGLLMKYVRQLGEDAIAAMKTA